jgi:hypothetical protein
VGIDVSKAGWCRLEDNELASAGNTCWEACQLESVPAPKRNPTLYCSSWWGSLWGQAYSPASKLPEHAPFQQRLFAQHLAAQTSLGAHS